MCHLHATQKACGSCKFIFDSVAKWFYCCRATLQTHPDTHDDTHATIHPDTLRWGDRYINLHSVSEAFTNTVRISPCNVSTYTDSVVYTTSAVETCSECSEAIIGTRPNSQQQQSGEQSGQEDVVPNGCLEGEEKTTPELD